MVNLALQTTFLWPEKIGSPVISLVLQPRYSNLPVITSTFHGPKVQPVIGLRCTCLAREEASDQIEQSRAKINEQKIDIAGISQLIEVTKEKH